MSELGLKAGEQGYECISILRSSLSGSTKYSTDLEQLLKKARSQIKRRGKGATLFKTFKTSNKTLKSSLKWTGSQRSDAGGVEKCEAERFQ